MRSLKVMLSLILLPMAVQAASIPLTTIRIIKMDAGTRVLFSFTQPVNRHVSNLENPNRIAIDFDQARLTENLQSLNLPNPEISAIRSSYPKPGVLRLVVTINPSANYTVAPDIKSDRYVLDIFAGSKVVSKREPIPVLIRRQQKAYFTVVIDPGHGGKDPGAGGVHGTKEKDVVLAIAKQLATLIAAQPNMRVVLTRNGDYFVTLRDRLELARKDKADLFVAIHADSYFNKSATGVSMYALSQRGATSEAARWIAKRENNSELGGVDLGELQDQSFLLRSVLIDLSQTATITDSMHLGATMLNSLASVTELHYTRVEQAPFVVLKSPDIPSVLVETGFISNPKEESRLRNKKYQNKIALALFSGIRSYIKKYSPAG